MPDSQAQHRIATIVLSLVAAAIPVSVVCLLQNLSSLHRLPQPASNGSTFAVSRQTFQRAVIAPETNPPPWITNAQIVDLDDDGRNDVLACDARWNCLVCYAQRQSGQWEPQVLATDIVAPAHATVVDLDGDGDRDVVVAALGSIWPDNGVIGRVVWLEKTDVGFVPRVILADVRRVADVQTADFDQDGDVDLVVAVFGYDCGELLWLEQLPDHRFETHSVFVGAGAIHVPVADYDSDGDVDFAAVVSQDDEEVWGFENDGRGAFKPRRLFGSLNDDLGSAGLVLTDLDRDGDDDLLLPVGDNLEDLHSYPLPYHGCFWLENRGDWNFVTERIATFGGTYTAAPGDLDGDGDVDVVLGSMFNDWDRPGHASVVWLENDGQQHFTPWQIDTAPNHIVTVACGDLNADGQLDIVAGAMQLIGPFHSGSGVAAWVNSVERAP